MHMYLEVATYLSNQVYLFIVFYRIRLNTIYVLYLYRQAINAVKAVSAN